MNFLLAQLAPFADLLAQVRPNQPGGGGPDAGAGGAIVAIISGICYFLFIALVLAVFIGSYWKIYAKADKPGWAAIVPIYGQMVLAEVCGKPSWWGILCCVPCIGPIFAILLMLELAKVFGKEIGYAIGLILLPIVFLPMLAFGSAKYVGPQTAYGGRDDDRPRRRRPRDDDDDYEDRPRRRRPRDDDDDDR